MDIYICAIIKNEHQYLKEWIDWHLSIGVNHIYLCEDIGSKSHADIIKDYDQVTLFPFNDEIAQYDRQGHASSWRQRSLFDWFLDTHRGVADWCAFIDVDEFITLENYENISEFLADYTDYNGIYLSWKMIGANGHIKSPKSNVVEAYTKEAKGWIACDHHYAFKSIVNLHRNGYITGIHCVNEGVNVFKMTTNRIRIYKKAWINHYFTKSWEDWCNRVLRRGDVCTGNRKLKQFFETNPDMLSIADELYQFAKDNYSNNEQKSIPKIIHCCWLSGDPLPQQYQECFNSWKKIMPDYEIKMWTKDNFDIDSVPFVRQAFDQKAYAFASDYIRVWALYNFGGIYLDMDVFAYKSFDELLHLPYFIGKERKDEFVLEAAIMGWRKGSYMMKLIMDMYDGSQFKRDQQVAPQLYKWVLEGCVQYFKNIYSIEEFDYSPAVLNVFDKEFFSPYDYQEQKLYKTENSFCYHMFVSEWRKTLNRPYINKK